MNFFVLSRLNLCTLKILGDCYTISMRAPWFKLNKWKTGWVPISWHGWVLTGGYIFFVIYNFIRIDQGSHSISDTLINFILQTIISTGLFSVVCYFTSDNSSGKNMLE